MPNKHFAGPIIQQPMKTKLHHFVSIEKIENKYCQTNIENKYLQN